MVKASPTRDDELVLSLNLDNVHEYKKYDCRRYLDCLQFTADEDWGQFHCNNCKAYERAELNPEERDALIRFGQALKNVLK